MPPVAFRGVLPLGGASSSIVMAPHVGKDAAMQFFCFHHDRPLSRDMRIRLLEQHWSYMDRYEESLVLRGPTYNDDEELTGSVHIVDLPSREAAWAFAMGEPGYQAGVYQDVMVRRWQDCLGRKMWDYPCRSDPDGLFLVVGYRPEPIPPVQAAAPDGDLVAYGHLLDDEGIRQVGAAAVVRADSEVAAAGILEGADLVGVEVRRWTFGGRR